MGQLCSTREKAMAGCGAQWYRPATSTGYWWQVRRRTELRHDRADSGTQDPFGRPV